MPGRKPKPPALKEATGNPGKRPIPEHNVPQAKPASMPAYVKDHPGATDIWDEYAPSLVELGSLTKRSERMFAMWCVELSRYERSPKRFTASRITQVRSLASSLGIDPSALGKFSTPSNADQDPADEFFTGPRLASG